MISLLKYFYDKLRFSTSFQYRQQVLKEKFQDSLEKSYDPVTPYGFGLNIEFDFEEAERDQFEETTSVEEEYNDIIEGHKLQRTKNNSSTSKINESLNIVDLINFKENVAKATSEDNEQEKIVKELKCFEDVGIVTELNDEQGVIDGTIPFKKSAAFKLFKDLKLGCKVIYLAYFLHEASTEFNIVKIKEIMESIWDVNESQTLNEVEDGPSRRKYFEVHERKLNGVVVNKFANNQYLSIEIDQDWFTVHANACSMGIELEVGDKVLAECKVQTDYSYFNQIGGILQVLSIQPTRIFKNQTLRLIDFYVNEHDPCNSYGELTDKTYFKINLLSKEDAASVTKRKHQRVSVHSIECQTKKFFKRAIQMKFLESLNESDADDKENDPIPSACLLVSLPDDCLYTFDGLGHTEIIAIKFKNLYSHKLQCENVVIMKPLDRTLKNQVVLPKGHYGCRRFYVKGNGGEFVLELKIVTKYLGHNQETVLFKFKHFTIKRNIHIQVNQANVTEDESAEALIISEDWVPSTEYDASPRNEDAESFAAEAHLKECRPANNNSEYSSSPRNEDAESFAGETNLNGCRPANNNSEYSSSPRNEDAESFAAEAHLKDYAPANNNSYYYSSPRNEEASEKTFDNEHADANDTTTTANEDNPFRKSLNSTVECSQNINDFVNLPREAASETYNGKMRANSVWVQQYNIVPGISLHRPRRFVAHRIDNYDVPTDLRRIYLTSESTKQMLDNMEDFYPFLRTDLCIDNYVSFFQIYIFLEEVETFVQFRKYDQDRAHFQRESEYLVLVVEDLAERRPSPVVGDIVRAYNPFEEPPKKLKHLPYFKQKCYDGHIHKVFHNKLCLKFNPNFQNCYNGEDYRIEFHFSRFPYRKHHHAVQKMKQNFPANFLFPKELKLNPRQVQLKADLDDDGNLFIDNQPAAWNNPLLNPIQKLAICNILRSESVDLPYIIFGPPGTGKTVTLVETIVQLIKHVSHARLLVCSPSNSSANLIATKLIEMGKMKPGDFVRVVAYNSVDKELIPPHLCPYSATIDVALEGTCEDEMQITGSGLKLNCQMRYFGTHPITISTCTTIGSFHLLKFPPNHFTHVIVDEAAQCSEPEVMIPISLLSPKSNGQVILAGDPNQLEGITINFYSKRKGPPSSYLTRLLRTSPLYRKNLNKFPKNNGYNPLLVTKLVYNYRALPSILKIYNELFYNGELRPTIDPENSREAALLALCKTVLPAGNKPSPLTAKNGVYFYGLMSENMQTADSPSWYNPLEAKHVFLSVIRLYSIGIQPDQIGIITPYAKQVKHLRLLFENAETAAPKIGSVEEFQSQERDIIFISTVRSQQGHLEVDQRHMLGFICNPKRTNVAISRARCLNYIVGNPYILQNDKSWSHVIKHCIENGTYAGCDF